MNVYWFNHITIKENQRNLTIVIKSPLLNLIKELGLEVHNPLGLYAIHMLKYQLTNSTYKGINF